VSTASVGRLVVVPLVVATANVLGSLGDARALECVVEVLQRRPDVVALQEWHVRRRRLLDGLVDYRWFRPFVGGCVLGVLNNRFEVMSTRSVPLSRVGRGDRDGRALAVEPPRRAAMVTVRDRDTRTPVTLISFHLVSQVQARDVYRARDRPRLVARHRREAAVLADLVAGISMPTYAAGDSNFHGFALPGLVSSFEAAIDVGGTLGPRRQVDDIFGPASPHHVELVDTPSDHRAVVASYL
jgi:hypothetical protein